MKFYFILLFFLDFTLLHSINLEDIIKSATQPKLFEKIIQEEQLALESKKLANRETAPLTYNQSLSRSEGGVYGFEHEISFSKEFKLGNILALEQQQNQLNNEAYLLEEERKIYRYEYYLKTLYHEYCLKAFYFDNFEKEVKQFRVLYRKKEHAFKEDEISRKELLQLDLEKERLEESLKRVEMEQANAKKQLLDLTILQSKEALFCQDLSPILMKVTLKDNAFNLTEKAYDKRIESTQVGLKRYTQKLESIEVEMGYTKELDRDMYTIGVSIPLNFSTRKSEYEKASLLHYSSVLSLKNQQIIEERNSKIKVFQKRLEEAFISIEAQAKMIQRYQDTLLPLMKKSYQYGESSVIEYLLSQQKLYHWQQVLLEKKQGYYKTLFQFYSMSEIRG